MSRLRRVGRRRKNAAGQEAVPQEAVAQDAAPTIASPKAQERSRADTATFLRENARILLALGLLALGVVLVLLGWYGAANTNILTEQIPYLISGGLLGMALIIVAGIVGSSASLSRENREMHADLTNVIGSASAGPLRSVPSPRRAANDAGVHLVPGGHSYHQPGCPIVEGKQGTELPLDEAIGAGYTTCKLCGPD
ncbi:MAG: hypothetical protein WEB06_04205 [Actinomycetota bacterium]